MSVIYEYATGSLHIPSVIPDHSAIGIKRRCTAGVAVNFGDVCYIDSNGKAQLVDSDAIATTSGVMMALETIALNGIGNFLELGTARDDTWNWTPGALLYASRTGTTGNTITADILTSIGTDDVVQVIGVAKSADYIDFKPNLMQVEHV